MATHIGNKRIIEHALALLGFHDLSADDELHPVPQMRAILPSILNEKLTTIGLNIARNVVQLNATDSANTIFKLPANFLIVNNFTHNGVEITNYDLIGDELITKSGYPNPTLDYQSSLEYIPYGAFDTAFGYELAGTIRPSTDDGNIAKANFFLQTAEKKFFSVANNALKSSKKPFPTNKFNVVNAR